MITAQETSANAVIKNRIRQNLIVTTVIHAMNGQKISALIEIVCFAKLDQINQMTNPSKSPERHSFQKEGYVKRMKEKGEEPSQDYLDMFEKILEQHDHKFDDPASRVDNMEYDLLTTDWILEKARADEAYAQNLYAAMCNNGFIKLDVIPILTEKEWSCSWRYAGGIVADMRREGDYIDWYCSGMGGVNAEYDAKETSEEWSARTGYKPEGFITNEVRADFQRLGWAVAPGGDWENFEQADNSK